MSSNVVLGMTSNGDSGSILLSLYRGSLMSMQLKVFPSMLFCHSTPSSDGQDEIFEVIIVFDPKIGSEIVEMFAIGRSEKKYFASFC